MISFFIEKNTYMTAQQAKEQTKNAKLLEALGAIQAAVASGEYNTSVYFLDDYTLEQLKSLGYTVETKDHRQYVDTGIFWRTVVELPSTRFTKISWEG